MRVEEDEINYRVKEEDKQHRRSHLREPSTAYKSAHRSRITVVIQSTVNCVLYMLL